LCTRSSTPRLSRAARQAPNRLMAAAIMLALVANEEQMARGHHLS